MIYFLDNSLQLQKIVTSKNVISAIHEHELNGLIRADVELDLAYANKFLILGIDHVGYYYKDEFYLHKIQRVEYDHVNETTKVVLRHIFFEDMIFGKLIQDVRPQNQDALTVSRQTIDANTRWQTIMTDVTGRLSTNFYWQVPYEVIEFMTENYRIEYLPKILFDGKKINGFQLHLANKIGEDKNIRIPYGSRVLDLKYEEDYSEIITKLVVHGKGEEVGDGYGRRINISDVNFSRNGVKSPVGSLYLEDESITNTYGNDGQTPREGREVFEDIEDPNELAEAGYQHYLQVSRPQMLFTADVSDIGDVGIGDSVMIIRREYDVYFNARIHKLSVDLLYPEDAQVELGDYEHFKESKIARKTREKNNRVQGQLSDRITRLKLEADERFDTEVEQWKSEYEQALIDVRAEIEADRENMTNLIEGTRTEFTNNLNAEITQTKEYAEQQAQAKAGAVGDKLDAFSERHETLVSDIGSDVSELKISNSNIQAAVSDGNGLASTIALSPTAIDLISDKINVTGNLNIKGGVTALAVDAIEGNFSRLFASSLTSNVIKSDHIEASTSLINKLFVNSARIDELITKTHFVNEMHALTLNVVDLNASQIRTKILSANTIEAGWLKSDVALIDRIFSSTAMFERMMSKTGFVTSFGAVTISADQITSGTLHAHNDNFYLNLSTGNMYFRSGANIRFYNEGVAMQFSKLNYTVGMAFESHPRSAQYPAVWMGGTSSSSVVADHSSFTGVWAIPYNNELDISGRTIRIRSDSGLTNSNTRGIEIDLSSSSSGRITPIATYSNRYYFGRDNAKWWEVHTEYLNRMRLSGNDDFQAILRGSNNGIEFRNDGIVLIHKGGRYNLDYILNRLAY